MQLRGPVVGHVQIARAEAYKAETGLPAETLAQAQLVSGATTCLLCMTVACSSTVRSLVRLVLLPAMRSWWSRLARC